MSLSSIFRILRKDIRMGPRSPITFFMFFMPLLVTFLIQVAFGDLFNDLPRLGIVDEEGSAVASRLFEMDGLQVSIVETISELESLVESNDLDAGLVLPRGFDASLASGDKPPLNMFISGESLAYERVVLESVTLGVMSDAGPNPSPVEVEVKRLGEEGLPWDAKAAPALAVYALLITGVFLPAFAIADEREKKTVTAVISTPATLGDLIAAKGLLGLLLSLPMTMGILWLNGSLADRPLALLAVISVGAVLFSVLGMVYGAAAKEVAGVFALIKGTAIILMAPALFYLFPDWPQWIARIFPTYWVIDPVYRVAIQGADLSSVWGNLVIGLAVAGIPLIPLVFLTKRLRYQLAAS